MTDTRIYLGRPGALAAIRSPRGTVESTRQRRTGTFGLGVGGVAVDQMVGGARTWTINYERLLRDDFATLQAFLDGHEGPGPFVLLDPGHRNMLPANVAAATSVINSPTSIRPVGGFETGGISDTYNRAPVASGWGSTETGEAYTSVGGTAANYSVNGTAGLMSLSALSTTYRQRLAGIVARDIDITVTLSISALLTGSGGSIENGVRVRYVDDNNLCDLRIFRNVNSSNCTIALRQRVGGVDTATSFPAISGSANNSTVRVRIVASGSTLQAWAWLPASGSMSTTPQLSLGSVTMLTPGAVEVYAAPNSSVTNTLPLTATWDDLVGTYAGTPLASSTAYTDAGPRVLAWSDMFTSLRIDWPSSTFAYGVPVVSGRPICFSCQLRGGGADPVVTLTPQIIWRDASGTDLGSTTSGGSATTGSGAWTANSAFFATGTPPAGAVYADPIVRHTSGASTGSIVYLRRFLLNEGSTPDTLWTPGTGVFPVRFLSMTDAWPFVSPELREAPVAVLQEDVS